LVQSRARLVLAPLRVGPVGALVGRAVVQAREEAEPRGRQRPRPDAQLVLQLPQRRPLPGPRRRSRPRETSEVGVQASVPLRPTASGASAFERPCTGVVCGAGVAQPAPCARTLRLPAQTAVTVDRAARN